jgi:hypothetical protein
LERVGFAVRDPTPGRQGLANGRRGHYSAGASTHGKRARGVKIDGHAVIVGEDAYIKK